MSKIQIIGLLCFLIMISTSHAQVSRLVIEDASLTGAQNKTITHPEGMIMLRNQHDNQGQSWVIASLHDKESSDLVWVRALSCDGEQVKLFNVVLDRKNAYLFFQKDQFGLNGQNDQIMVVGENFTSKTEATGPGRALSSTAYDYDN